MVSGAIPAVPPYVNLSRHKPVLPEVLKAHGMITAADNANCWSFFDLVDRGWDSFKFFPGWQLKVPGHPETADPFYNTAPGTLSWAERWLTDHKDQRFFLWVHFMEPHSPYNAPREYDRFKTPDDFPSLYEDNESDSTKLQSLAKIGNVHAIKRLQQLYAAKIMYVDHYVGELTKTLHTLDLDKNTIIILVSDHGQLLYSHPEDFNTDDHRSVYDADLHIPLIFRGPGILSGRRLNAFVSHYDLLPTILELENLPPVSPADGTSLKGVLLGTSSHAHEYLYGEETSLEPQYSVRDERYKLIESLRSGKIQCFDTAIDPDEKRDVCADLPRQAADLKHALDVHIQAMIREAKAYPDWEDNIALAVIEQRESKALLALAPGDLTISPDSGAESQLSSPLWWLSADSPDCPGLCYWAPAGPDTASMVWRFDTPMIGDYEISISYGGTGDAAKSLATNANFTVRFKGGTLSFPIDQNRNQGRWNLLGSFHDPLSVELTNRADGPVVAGAVRFRRLQQEPR
jgi:arylsulfatase A-like enzyme